MLNVSRGFEFLDLDAIKFHKTNQRAFEQMLRQAAREFLVGVLTSVRGRFPIWSGAAISTLAPLGRYLNVRFDTTPRPGKDGRKPPDRRAWGESQSQFNITINHSTQVYHFDWATDLVHYLLNDDPGTPTVASSPWLSVPIGKERMENYINEAIQRRLPKISAFVKFVEQGEF